MRSGLARRMASSVGFLQLREAHLGVDLGRLQAGVAELLLHVADVRAVVEHVRRAGVAEEMAAAGLLQTSLQGHSLDHRRQAKINSLSLQKAYTVQKVLSLFKGSDVG